MNRLLFVLGTFVKTNNLESRRCYKQNVSVRVSKLTDENFVSFANVNVFKQLQLVARQCK